MMRQLLYFVFVGISVAQICPPAQVLSPCTCDQEYYSIECSNIEGYFDLKGIFDNASQFVGDDVVFDDLLIAENTALFEIEENAINSLKFYFVLINSNPNLEYISPRAFNATRDATIVLDLSDNNPRNDSDIFDLIAGFTNLMQVGSGLNQISSIPDRAFQNHPFLVELFLNMNNISSIGSKAFATGGDLSNLLDLSNNAIPSGGLPEDAFDGLSPSLYVSLRCNEMEFMEQKSFQTLLDTVETVEIGGEYCSPDEPSYRRFHCDERADWLCDNEISYRPKLRGFLCKTDSGFGHIWDYCASRNMSLGEIY